MPCTYLRCLLVLALLVAGRSGLAAFEWPRVAPGEVGVDAAMLADLDARIRAGEFGAQKSLLVVRHGRLVHEQYYNGHHANEVMPLYSVTKSWASALLGIALRDGDLASVDVPLSDLFPQYGEVFANQPRKQQMSVRDVLTHRQGLAWDEWSTGFNQSSNPANQMMRSSDWWRFVLTRSATADPDTVFRYSTGGANLIGGMLWNRLGVTALDYASVTLHEALDISDWHVEVDWGTPRGTGITQFQPGFTPTGHGLWLRPADMAKIGQLYLDRGVWQNHRLVNASWVKDSWQPYSDAGTDPQVFDEGLSYGYQWWNLQLDADEGGHLLHFANGWGQQYIIVVPKLDLVVVSTADNGSWNGPGMVTATRQRILPAVAEDFDPVADGGLTGSWYAPELRHQGFMLEVVPTTGQVVIYWMNYEPGTGAQQWMFAVGILHGRRAVLEFLRPQDGEFAGTRPARLDHWGDAELLFTGCTTATMTFHSQVAGLDGAMNLRRLTPNVSCR